MRTVVKRGAERGIDEVSRRYCEEVWGAAMDDQVRLALSRAVESFRANRDDALRLYPRVVEKARRLREVKDSSLGRVGELAKEARDRKFLMTLATSAPERKACASTPSGTIR